MKSEISSYITIGIVTVVRSLRGAIEIERGRHRWRCDSTRLTGFDHFDLYFF